MTHRIPSKDLEVFSRKEAAQFLGISIKTLSRWTYEFNIPYVALGRLIKYLRSDLEKFLESHKCIKINTEELKSGDE